MSRFLIFACLVLTTMVFFSAETLASTTGSVGSPKVKKGQKEVAVRFGYSEAEESSSQDERFRTRVHFKYGFTDVYALQIIAAQDKRKGDSYEHDDISIENRFYLLKAEDYGFDFGVRLTYEHADGDKEPSQFELGFHELVPLGDYEFRSIQRFSKSVGDESENGVEGLARFQLTKSIADGYRLGLESFHDFDNLSELSGYSDQSHTIGPVLKGRLFDNYKYETGYRAGISEGAPDHNFKFFLSRRF